MTIIIIALCLIVSFPIAVGLGRLLKKRAKELEE